MMTVWWLLVLSASGLVYLLSSQHQDAIHDFDYAIGLDGARHQVRCA